MLRCFYMNLNCDCSKEQSLALCECLTKERRERIERTANRELAEKRIMTGAFLHYGLHVVTGIPFQEIRYAYNAHGKPFLRWKQHLFDFNLSHSGEYAVLALKDGSVGIDVEHKTKNGLLVAKRCFCQEEYEDILHAGVWQEQRFLQYWTMKEAYVKYTGEGLSVPLNSFRIERKTEWSAEIVKKGCLVEQEHSVNVDTPAREAEVEDGAVTFVTMPFADSYVVSLCGDNLIKELAIQNEKSLFSSLFSRVEGSDLLTILE